MIKSQRQKIQKGKKCKDLKTVKIGQGEGYRGVKKKVTLNSNIVG